MYFVSSPYSHTDKAVVEQRMALLNKSIAKIQGQYFCVTPLWNHYILEYDNSIGSDWNFWKEYCEEMMKRCIGIIVLDNIDGWKESTGVDAEIKLAQKLNKPIIFFSDIQ
jgi:hypothetical protein